METLYALSINGSMLYIYGNLSDKECAKVDAIAEQMHRLGSEDTEDICQSFIDSVFTSQGIKLVQVPLKHVFRIKN